MKVNGLPAHRAVAFANRVNSAAIPSKHPACGLVPAPLVEKPRLRTGGANRITPMSGYGKVAALFP
jgi:hypothetical protein